jgi:diguanylate cyclase (GGDEF)-like protein
MRKLVSLAVSGSGALFLAGLSSKTAYLSSTDYLPHQFCYLAQPSLIWTNVITDGLIAVSYAMIFVALLIVFFGIRRTPSLRPYLWILLSFGTFILACAFTHVMEIVTVWFPVYPLAALIKVICATASVSTAILFARASPRLTKGLVHFLDVDSALQRANSELQELAVRDVLTRLNNRRHFESALASEWQRSTRTSCSIAILMMDVDHFKLLNDNYGHLVGDQCLQQIGGLLASKKWRTEDLIARYGGEEFALLLPGANNAAAGVIAEEIRQAIMGLRIENAKSPVSPVVTLSIGVASRIPFHGQEPRELLAAADAALYAAKNKGRNRVEFEVRAAPRPPDRPEGADLAGLATPLNPGA